MNTPSINFHADHLTYKTMLETDVLPFWRKHAPDWENGGYWHSLQRDGTVFDRDKYMWMQARIAWTFAAYAHIEDGSDREKKLACAKLGIDFLRKFGSNADGDYYFALNESGAPLVAPYNIFSDCFATLAFSKYAEVTGESESADEARKIWKNILRRVGSEAGPKGIYTKQISTHRPAKNLGIPMMLCYLAMELGHSLDDQSFFSQAQAYAQELQAFYVQDKGIYLEQVGMNGEQLDTYSGRLLNAGHSIETAWFILNIGEHFGDSNLIEHALKTIVKSLELGWDSEYGGIYSFLDITSVPATQPSMSPTGPISDWDRKLWWGHQEAIIALLLALKHRPDDLVLSGWYEKVRTYTLKHFPDPEYGEWYGYLSREGKPFSTIKGGIWKSSYHICRMLDMASTLAEELSQRKI